MALYKTHTIVYGFTISDAMKQNNNIQLTRTLVLQDDFLIYSQLETKVTETEIAETKGRKLSNRFNKISYKM